MAHLQYMPGDPRLVDQLVYELKSKGIFDQFRKDCIADVDTRPAYQNLRQRVESSVSVFLSRQTWKPDLNKNQLREKLRKHILDGNYLEQGVERIVDQVVNPKVAAVFKPQVEDLVYNYLGIPRKRTPKAETVEKTEELLPIDLEAVSPGSVKSNDDEKNDLENKVQDMDIDSEEKPETTEEMSVDGLKDEVLSDDLCLDKSSIPLPTEEINLENIPAPDNSPEPVKIELESIDLPIELEKPTNVELKNIELPKEPNLSIDIPLPDELSVTSNDNIFKPIQSEDSNTSSGSSIRRNMSPLTPVRNFDDENSCDAQQAFENNSDENNREEPSTFQFNIETKVSNDSSDDKVDKKTEQLSYQFTNQVNINTYNTPMYDDSSNSHNLQIDYESDANTNNSKTTEVKQDVETGQDSKKERKDDKKNQNKSHRSRDSSRHSSSKHSSSRDSSRHDKKTSKDDKSKSSKDRETSKDGSDKKDSSKYRSSHKSSSSSKDKHRSSSHKHSSSKSTDERKSSSKDKSSEKDKEKSSDKSSKDRKDSKSSSHRDKDRKGSKKDDKDKKKDKKDVDDHYSSSGRGNHSRRSTDRDSNDGSSSSKGSQGQNNSKSTTDSKKESKSSSSKSDNTSTSSESTSQSDKEHMVTNKILQFKPIVRVENHLETPIANPPRLPFVPDVTLKKPKFANNFEEAKKMMKMRKFLAEEQKRMNQEAALLLEFQANVRPSLSQVYSSISGPELEFACVTHPEPEIVPQNTLERDTAKKDINFVVCDSIIPETIVCSIEEPLEMSIIAKNTKDIINDIIGVPIEEYNEQRNNDIIESNIGENHILLDIYETKNDSYEDIQPSQIVKEVIKQDKASERCPDSLEESLAGIVHDDSTEFEITVTAETLSETDVSEILEMKEDEFPEKELQYFAEHEKYGAELERHKFSDFLSKYIESNNVSNKMYVINCDTYEENIVKEVAAKFGDYEVVNYYKNGHLVPNKNIVKDVALSAEVSLPLDSNDYDESSLLFSPAKSECSFDLSSDYDAKLDEIVNKKSRQEVMEIILGGIIDESNKMPTIDYYTELSDSENLNLTIVENTLAEVEIESTDNTLKRRIIEEAGNNNRSVLTPNKIRKMSESDQISSTTEEPEVSNNNKVQTATRSKYLGRAKRVGLSKPKKCNLPNSPSSDKSVENYTQNTPTPNGKLKATPRSKFQRYDTSDLYKPKLHYLSRRNNIS